jgi:D-alanyl-D-alanine carboxypeptidase
VIVLASLPTALAADGLDDSIAAKLARRRVPGLALAVLRDGQPPLLRAYGLASVELAVPVTVDTVFDLGSVTKPFTAMAIMTLVTDGKLSLDDPIARYVDHTPPAWALRLSRHELFPPRHDHRAGIG